jgi:transcriptional regulator with XRE-family HTH domain
LKPEHIQRSERAIIEAVAAKRARHIDEPVAWYCVMRLKQLIDQGIQQKQIADDSGLTASAINHLVRNAQGAGPATAAALAEYLGFPTRGALVDAADAWWAKEGKLYVLETMRAAQRERERVLMVAEKTAHDTPKGRRSIGQ